jgi:hypothetical protein
MKPLKTGFVAAFVATGIGLVALTHGTTGCSVASQVSSVYMALDGEGARPRDTFYPDTLTIFCDVDWVGRDPDTTVNAFIHQHKGEQAPGTGSLAPVERLYGVGEVVGGEQKSNISFAWTLQSDAGGPQPYPVGHYTCDVEVNGVAAGSAPFDITYPGCQKTDPSNCQGPGTDCPLGGAATGGAICLSIYKNGSQCPSVNNTTNPTDCTCDDASGLWKCAD